MSDYFKPLKPSSFQNKSNKYHQLEAWKLLYVYEYSKLEKTQLVKGWLRQYQINQQHYDFDLKIYIANIVKFVDDGIIQRINKASTTIKYGIQRHNIWTGDILKGVIYGDIWYQAHPQTQQTYLHTDLRHNLGTEFDDLQIHYLATYTFNIASEDGEIQSNHVVWYEDEIPILSEKVHPVLIPGYRSWGYPIVKLAQYPNFQGLEIRISAAWHEPFDYFWIIKQKEQ